jgi:hypothetical protein
MQMFSPAGARRSPTGLDARPAGLFRKVLLVLLGHDLHLSNASARRRDRERHPRMAATDSSPHSLATVSAMADDKTQLAILKAIRVAEGAERSLVSISSLTESINTRTHLSAQEITTAVEALFRGGLITGIGDTRTGLRFVQLTRAGRRRADSS